MLWPLVKEPLYNAVSREHEGRRSGAFAGARFGFYLMYTPGMILGVMSDTHGNRRLMFQVAELMQKDLEVDLIYHLGDDYEDAEELAFAGYPVRMVPGLWCSAYQMASIPKRLRDEIGGLTVACAHAAKDLRHVERAASLILTGHTHEARIEPLGASLYVNPGHLNRSQRGGAPSFAVVSIEPDDVRAAIHETSGVIRTEQTVSRSRLA